MSNLTVGIATRDRWIDLTLSLRRLEGFLSPMVREVIVVDDGSSSPAPASLTREFPFLQIIRLEQSVGPIRARNRLAAEARSDYLLFVDDDSFPVSGSLAAAVVHLDQNPGLLALALNVMARGSDDPPIPANLAPFPVQRFINCGVIVRRTAFLELGGFREALTYYCEEGEFCARGARAGWRIEFYPALKIFHNRTPTSRNSRRIAYQQGRNRALTVLWTYPLLAWIVRLPLSLPGTLILVSPRDRLAAIGGFFAGLRVGVTHWHERTPLSLRAYVRFRRLSWVPQSQPDRDYMAEGPESPAGSRLPPSRASIS